MERDVNGDEERRGEDEIRVRRETVVGRQTKEREELEIVKERGVEWRRKLSERIEWDIFEEMSEICWGRRESVTAEKRNDEKIK